MKTFALAVAAGLFATAASAQTTTTTPNTPATPARPAPPVVTTPGATLPASPGVNTSTGTDSGASVVNRNTGAAAAAGDRNQAVTTTGENAPQPAKGANSFSEGEARRRIESNGFATVTDLKKDDDGIWRGSAMKDSAKVAVWLDYKGNIGQQ